LERHHPIWLAIAWISVLAGAVILLSDLFPRLQQVPGLAVLAAVGPYGALLWLFAVAVIAIAGKRRGRLLSLVALAGLIGHATLLIPYAPQQPPEGTAQFRVMELNLCFGRANLNQLYVQVERYLPEVVVLTEITEGNVATLDNPLWNAAYPYHLGTPGKDAANGIGDPSGTVVYAKHALTPLDGLQDMTNQAVVAKVSNNDDPDSSFTIVAAHMVNPLRDPNAWVADGDKLVSLAASNSATPLVIAGDLNATHESLPMRLLTSAGMADAKMSSGSGWQPTFPSNLMPIPPLVAIDHILVNDSFEALAVTPISVSGTDHLGLVADLALASVR
jgi:endonuclease/exonuclease/phosphatase (EEP) superfamily protein YafD